MELCPENLSNLTSVSHTACASNAMDILLYISWHVKVDHMAHIWNIQATSSNLKHKIISQPSFQIFWNKNCLIYQKTVLVYLQL